MSIDVYTDGSLRREKTGIVCGYGIYFPQDVRTKYNLKNVAGAFTLEPLTNNRAELYAIYRAIKILQKSNLLDLDITIYTDSEYSMKSLTVWIHKWKRNNFKDAKSKPIKNVDLITKIDTLLSNRPNIQIKWVRAHANNYYNEMADRLANKGADIFKLKYIKN